MMHRYVIFLLQFFSGSDYACDVHVISVDMGSPAEKAGVKAGDEIVAVSVSILSSYTPYYKIWKIHYSFVSLLIGPCCLDPICRIQRNIWLKTRQQGPINMETKESCIFHHFGIRCINK